MVTSYTGVFGGNAIQPAQTSYSKIDLDADVQLSWPTSFVDTKNVVSGIIEVDASTPDLNLYFPNAQLTSLGTLVIITNVGADTFNVMKFGSAPDGLPILVAPPGSTNCIYLTNNSDNEGGIGGSWTAVPYGTGSTAISSISLESDDESLVIDNGVINNTGEVVQFNLADNLNSLGGMTAAGIAVQDGANGWLSRSITGMGNNITVTNGDGVLGNPSISLTADVDGLEKISVAQLVLENNTLSSSTNNNLNLSAAAGKEVLIGSGVNKVKIDTNGNVNGGSTLTAGNIIGSLTGNFGDLNLSTNVISSSTLNNDVVISPNGTGKTVINGNLDVTGTVTSVGGGYPLKLYVIFNYLTGAIISTQVGTPPTIVFTAGASAGGLTWNFCTITFGTAFSVYPLPTISVAPTSFGSVNINSLNETQVTLQFYYATTAPANPPVCYAGFFGNG